MPDPQNRANASDVAGAIKDLPTGFTLSEGSIICPSGLRWTLNSGNGFDVSLRGNTIHVPYEEFMVVDRYLEHMKTGAQSVT